ncbi:MAG: 2-oxoacid:acceptor oxidoreductase subunit alpha [bacterium]|nr:2-oxoacid:acceptor oxidoreductase subunit alpha [bacterium]
MNNSKKQLREVVIKFAGDSGDGIQLTGNQFAETTALFGNDIATFPDFPAEIRAPIGTVPGVSGFQLHFGDTHIFTPGDAYDVLVVMNAAALKTNLKSLKPNGIIIANISGFDSKNLRLANIPEEENPLENNSLHNYQVHKIDITKLTKLAVAEYNLGNKESERCKNMFVLGLVYWLYHRTMDKTIQFIEQRFKKEPIIANANITALKAGYNFGDTTESFTYQYEVAKAESQPGLYRSINGNQAMAMGFLAASLNAELPLFLGTYPITPASDILHELSKHKGYDVYTFQAEDEISGVCAAIGASYGGSIGITTSSGPGIALKTEAIGLATMLELPLVICNIQRGGPSTGLPTKTEQADLMQALYGRNGECPLVVIAPSTHSDCYEMAYIAIKIALEHTVPVMILSDGFIANGAEPWNIKTIEQLPPIKSNFITTDADSNNYMPYLRNANLSRNIAVPGTRNYEHRIGGLEKENITGNISYDPLNHELMVKLRAEKVERVADIIPPQKFESGNEKSSLLIIGWGSTYGSIGAAVNELNNEGYDVAQIHLKYINPLPANLEELIKPFDKVMVAELNNGQLIKLIRDKYLKDAIGINKIQGQPFMVKEIKESIINHLNNA